MSSLSTAGWQNELKITEDQCGSISNENAKRILAFLREGDKLNFTDELNQVIFLIGNTGSGKTTLANFLTNEDLVSYEVGEKSGEFILYRRDDDIDADSTVVSKTTYPSIFVDQKTGNIYIDVGGFNDTGRNEAFDMANAYFLKKVMEKAQHIKIVLVSDHSSLRKGVNRYDFVMLLQHVTFLFRNIEKYLDAVALIATKVDNNSISDAATINNMANFLVGVKNSLKNSRNSEQIYISNFYRKEKQAFVKKSILLIDTLLRKSDDNAEYARLGIFRRPDTKGPVSQIQPLQECKAKLSSMLNNLNYVSLNPDDLRYSVSSKTKIILKDLADEIHQNVESNLNQFVEELVAYYEREVSRLSDDKEALKDLVTSSKCLARIRSTNESSSLKDFVSNIQKNLTDSCKQVIGSFILDIEYLDKFLHFIGELASRNFAFCVKKWIKSLEGVTTFLENALASASEVVKQSKSSFFDWIKQLVNSFKQKVRDIFNKLIECLNSS